MSKKDKLRNISELIMGFCLLFLGLSLMKGAVPNLSETPQVLEFITNWSGHGFASVLLFLIFGTVLTLILQSSSATVALTLVFLNMGWLQFDMAAAMVLGENIGTTITANIAAAVGNTNARRAALAHTVFNVFGVLWVLAIFHPFVSFVQWIVSRMNVDEATSMVYGISMLHTVFNIINTFIMIWFTKLIEKIVTTVIKDKADTEQNPDGHIKYIDYGLISTPELALVESSKEVIRFGKVMNNALAYLEDAITYADNADRFPGYRDKLVKYEEISDCLEYEIVNFLNDLGKNHLSDESKALVRSQVAKLCKMIGYVSQAYEEMIWNLENADKIRDIRNAENAEVEINAFRDECRDLELKEIDTKGDAYFETVFYLNILEQLEKMGDYLINISQSIKIKP